MSRIIGVEADKPKRKRVIPRLYPRWETPNPIDATLDPSLNIIIRTRQAAEEVLLAYRHVKFKDRHIGLGKWYKEYLRKIG